MSCALASAAGADGLADARQWRGPGAARSSSGSEAARRLAAQLGQLRARQRAGPNARPARSRRPPRAKPERRGARADRAAADHADDRRRVDRAVGRPRCRARRCRRPPARRARGRRRACPRPRASSCQAMCGFSGLPKFRQLVRPSGSAPTQARLRRALEHRLGRAHAAGRRPRAGRCRRSTTRDRAAPPSAAMQHGGVGLFGPAHRARADEPVVLLEQRQRCEAMFGEPSSASSVSSAWRRPQGARAGRAGRPARSGRCGLEVVERAVVDQRRHGHVADELVAVEHAQAAGVGHLADRGRAWSPTSRTPRAPRRAARARPRRASAPGTRRP